MLKTNQMKHFITEIYQNRESTIYIPNLFHNPVGFGESLFGAQARKE